VEVILLRLANQKSLKNDTLDNKSHLAPYYLKEKGAISSGQNPSCFMLRNINLSLPATFE